jgi:hypothetical protein
VEAPDAEEPAEPVVIAGHRVAATQVEDEVAAEDRGQGIVILIEDRLRHTVHDVDVGMIATHGSSRGLISASGGPYEARLLLRIGRTNDSSAGSSQRFC